jgi:hypothetical protein
MAKAQLECPSCGSKVELGDITCKVCGVNLKSGESFETRVRQARGTAVHPEHFTGRIYISVVMAFGLVVFSGLMYQIIVEKTISQVPELFRYPVEKLEEIRGLVARADTEAAEGHKLLAKGDTEAAQGHQEEAQQVYRLARQRTEELIQWLTSEADAIVVETPFRAEGPKRHSYRQEKEYNKPVAKRLLKDLRAKAQVELDRIPAA